MFGKPFKAGVSPGLYFKPIKMEKAIGIDANDTEVSVKKSDSLLLQLEETLTAGFEWAVESLPAFCTLASTDYTPPRTTAAGGSGMRTLRLHVNDTGEGTLVLKNHQRWSGAVDKRFRLKINAT